MLVTKNSWVDLESLQQAPPLQCRARQRIKVLDPNVQDWLNAHHRSKIGIERESVLVEDTVEIGRHRVQMVV